MPIIAVALWLLSSISTEFVLWYAAPSNRNTELSTLKFLSFLNCVSRDSIKFENTMWLVVPW